MLVKHDWLLKGKKWLQKNEIGTRKMLKNIIFIGDGFLVLPTEKVNFINWWTFKEKNKIKFNINTGSPAYEHNSVES